MQIALFPHEQIVADKVTKLIVEVIKGFDGKKIGLIEDRLIKFDIESKLISTFNLREKDLPKIELDRKSRSFTVPAGEWIYFIKDLYEKSSG